MITETEYKEKYEAALLQIGDLRHKLDLAEQQLGGRSEAEAFVERLTDMVNPKCEHGGRINTCDECEKKRCNCDYAYTREHDDTCPRKP